MYGMDFSLPTLGIGLGTSGLALTGLNVGSTLLTALGIAFMGIALFALFRPESKVKP